MVRMTNVRYNFIKERRSAFFNVLFIGVWLRDLASLLAIGISVSNLDNLLFRILAASYREDYNQSISSDVRV